MTKLSLRPVADADIATLASWLEKEYILKWYHDVDEWLCEINGRHNSFSWIRHFMVMDGCTPVGFCQYYDCFDAKELEDWYRADSRGDTFSIDYLIGDERYLGKGYGKAIVRLVTDAVRTREKANRIIVQPEEDNHASNRVLAANGYVFDKSNGFYCKRLTGPSEI